MAMTQPGHLQESCSWQVLPYQPAFRFVWEQESVPELFPVEALLIQLSADVVRQLSLLRTQDQDSDLAPGHLSRQDVQTRTSQAPQAPQDTVAVLVPVATRPAGSGH